MDLLAVVTTAVRATFGEGCLEAGGLATGFGLALDFVVGLIGGVAAAGVAGVDFFGFGVGAGGAGLTRFATVAAFFGSGRVAGGLVLDFLILEVVGGVEPSSSIPNRLPRSLSASELLPAPPKA